MCTYVFNKWWVVGKEGTKCMIFKSSSPLFYVVLKSRESEIRLPRFPASFFLSYNKVKPDFLPLVNTGHWTCLVWRETEMAGEKFLVSYYTEIISWLQTNDSVLCADQLLSKSQIRSLIFLQQYTEENATRLSCRLSQLSSNYQGRLSESFRPELCSLSSCRNFTYWTDFIISPWFLL